MARRYAVALRRRAGVRIQRTVFRSLQPVLSSHEAHSRLIVLVFRLP